MPDIERIQKELKAEGVDGWLLYDFRNRDPIAHAVLGLDFGGFTTRRWFYWIPTKRRAGAACLGGRVQEARPAPRGEERLPLLARAARRAQVHARVSEEGRDAVLAAGKRPVRLHRGRGHDRPDPLVRVRGGLVGGPGADLPGGARRGGVPLAPGRRASGCSASRTRRSRTSAARCGRAARSPSTTCSSSS